MNKYSPRWRISQEEERIRMRNYRGLLLLGLVALLIAACGSRGGQASPTSAAAPPLPALATQPTQLPTAAATKGTTGSKSGSKTGGKTGGKSVTLELTAKNLKFDKDTLTVPAGAHVVVKFTNQDS